MLPTNNAFMNRLNVILTNCEQPPLPIISLIFSQHNLAPHRAPMPYVIGIHSSLMEEVRKMLMNDSDVVIADIDDQQIESNFDDIQHIPHEVVSRMGHY